MTNETLNRTTAQNARRLFRAMRPEGVTDLEHRQYLRLREEGKGYPMSALWAWSIVKGYRKAKESPFWLSLDGETVVIDDDTMAQATATWDDCYDWNDNDCAPNYGEQFEMHRHRGACRADAAKYAQADMDAWATRTERHEVYQVVVTVFTRDGRTGTDALGGIEVEAFDDPYLYDVAMEMVDVAMANLKPIVWSRPTDDAATWAEAFGEEDAA